MENVQVIRSKRKTVSLEIKKDLTLLVRAPLWFKDADIERFIREKSEWIEIHREKMKSRQEESEPRLSKEEIYALADKALEIIPQKTAHYAKLMGVQYGRITIRNQVSRWGSCSSKRNLNFNCLLMLCPDEVVDYVIIHELCHLKEMNHSKRFWELVSVYCPEYKAHVEWLKTKGSIIISRMRSS